jgi:CRISPR system Cascade subunit CasE
MDLKRRHKVDAKVASESQTIQEAGLTWLSSQAQRAGFQLTTTEVETIGSDGLLEPAERPAVRIDGYQQHRLRRPGVRASDSDIRFSSLDFEGQLAVSDPELFLSSVRAGFGPQKAFGCGLMLLRRA